jgi:hypothetical protein
MAGLFMAFLGRLLCPLFCATVLGRGWHRGERGSQGRARRAQGSGGRVLWCTDSGAQKTEPRASGCSTVGAHGRVMGTQRRWRCG